MSNHKRKGKKQYNRVYIILMLRDFWSFCFAFLIRFVFFCAFILWFHFITFALRKVAIKKQLTQAAIFYGLLLLLLLLTILTSAACSSANLRFFYKPSSPSISAPLHTSSEQTQMYCINIYMYIRVCLHIRHNINI